MTTQIIGDKRKEDRILYNPNLIRRLNAPDKKGIITPKKEIIQPNKTIIIPTEIENP